MESPKIFYSWFNCASFSIDSTIDSTLRVKNVSKKHAL